MVMGAEQTVKTTVQTRIIKTQTHPGIFGSLLGSFKPANKSGSWNCGKKLPSPLHQHTHHPQQRLQQRPAKAAALGDARAFPSRYQTR